MARKHIGVPLLAAFSLLISAGAAQGAENKPKDPRRWSQGALKRADSVSGKNAPKAEVRIPQGDGAAVWRPRDVYWPPASRTAIDLGAKRPVSPPGAPFTKAVPVRPPTAPAADPSRAGTAPVWVGPASENGVSPAGKVDVELADRATAEKAGVQGLLLSVRPSKDAAVGDGPVKVSVDVSHIAGAFGGDWLSRARLISLPACVLTTPDRPECRTQTPVVTARQGDRVGLLSADISLKANTDTVGDKRPPSSAGAAGTSATSVGATVLAASAAPAGSAGDYKATSLAPSGTWSSGGSTGGFSWTYPIVTPEGLGSTKPDIALGYSSQSVDGRTAATNNQSSWIGEGWDYSPGFVERRFKPCSKDGQTGSGEQCMAGENATLSLNGKSSALIRDDASGVWRLEADDASKVERLTGAVNGDNNGEHWKVTTADGTQYYFGMGRKPGSPSAPATNSAWTTPVYGNNAGEECHQATFAASWCQQAWRWNLDFVVDPRGGVITHWYETETNHYKRGSTASAPGGTLTPYIRSGNLTKITYGSKLTDADSVKPTAQIVFDTTQRCLPDAGFDCAHSKLVKANATKWPDVPYDLHCAAAGSCENYSATFWTTKRLSKISTQVLNGTGGYDQVDSYELKHEFPNPQDGTAPTLWLASLTHIGHDGAGSLATPPVTFTGRLMNNRVDSSADNKPALNRRRIVGITSETGQVTDVGYADPDCAPGTGLPSAQDSNSKRCYPVYWAPDEKSSLDPTLDWFHKYVVTRVTELDPFGGSLAQEVRYEYVGPAAWHRDDEELTEDKRRTWNEFRGYEQVITRSGSAPDVVSRSAVFYLRGMDGDVKADGSRRTATFTGISGQTLKDSNPLAGTVRETQTFASDAGELVTVSQSDPWLSPVTATRGRGGKLPALTAQMHREGSIKKRSLRADRTWQSTSKVTTYDPAFGMPVSILDRADGLPDTCGTTSYVRNTAKWMIDRVSETVQVEGDCATAPKVGNTLGRSRTYYDGQSHGSLTGAGQVTSTEELDHFEGDQPEYTRISATAYDAYGRVVSVTDAVGAQTTTAYEPAGPTRATTVRTTNPKGWNTTSTLHALRSSEIKSVDENGRTTETSYDALGRVTSVWLPGRARDQSASKVFSYDLSNTGTSSITSQSLRADQSYATTISILDAFGEQIQQQSVPQNGAAGARLIADTAYDSHGRVHKNNETYFNTSSAPAKTRFLANDNAVPGQNTTVYDGLGRPVANVFSSKAAEQWRTTTAYPGIDRTDVTPPKGDTAVSTVTDSRGRKVEQRRFKGGKPEGDYDATRYSYSVDGELARITDPAGNAWTYDYDLHGRQVRVVDPDKGAGTITYDAADRAVSTTDARGTTVFTNYDILGRPTSRNLSAADGPKLATYEYDTVALGRPTASTSWVDGKPWRQETTGYDVGYRATDTKLVVPDGEGALTGTYSASTTYDPITGLERRSTLPAVGGLPSERLSAGRNVNGLPVSYGSDNVSYVNFTDYDPFGSVQRTTLGDDPRQVSVTNIQDPATGRLLNSRVDKQDSAVAVDTTDYTYTAAGDVTSVTSTQGATRDTQCFAYDPLRRLTAAWTDTGTTTTQPGPSVPGIGGCANTSPQQAKIGGSNPYHQSFTYDVTGNRTSSTDHDPAGDPTKNITNTYTFPDAGTPRPHAPISTTTRTGAASSAAKAITYDETGNTLTRPFGAEGVQALTWTAEGQLASATSSSGTSTYVYDADRKRLLRRDPGKTTLFIGSTELTLETGTNKVTGTRYYSAPGGTTIVRSSAGTLSYVAADHHNTGVTSIDAMTLQVQRRGSKPFGEDRGTKPAAWPGERGFVGGVQDTMTGLTHLGAREYDPRLGRFLSVDPIMAVDDPRQHHGYQYGNNSPLTEWDPTGEALEECRSGMYTCTNGGTRPTGYGNNYEREVSNNRGTLAPEYVRQKTRNKNACRHDPSCGRSSYSAPKSVSKPQRSKGKSLGRVALSGLKDGLLGQGGRWIVDNTERVKRGLNIAKDWAIEHRGLLATIASTAACLTPGLGWAVCAVATGIALGTRMSQRASEGGGWGKTWQDNTFDAIFTAGTFGVGSSIRYAKFGSLSGLKEPFRAPHPLQGRAWSGAAPQAWERAAERAGPVYDMVGAYSPLYTLGGAVPSVVGAFRDNN
ncbi:RHS repeat-associated core domain-containing protein [Streptomyces sp. Isolate_45]|uniref:RHS repeat-associated core domain-containing protein n=1 Tax=Streptomyces sp. Isolate_45 TaxID=2950111 RepID=UPI002481EC37|nr:RHS repeat-associated core domain-containing protein [Streptomyces sp. Isolate_45]MDA5279974.1 RHS repeat protein [Streptomyces sp. Isolate_45]